MPPVPARIARAISPARVSMHRPRVAVTLCVAALLSACGADAPTPDAGTLVVRDSLVAGDSIPVRVIESTDAVADERAAPFAVDTAPELVIGTDAGEEPYELHRVFDAMQWRDGRIIVGNSGSQELRLYDSAGVYLGSLGRKGGGPGEFSEYSSLNLYAWRDSLLVADDGRAHVYSPTLEFVSTRPFDVSSGPSRPFLRGVFADGSWAAFAAEGGGILNGPPGSIINMGFELLHYSATGVMQRSVRSYASRPRYVLNAAGRTGFPYVPLTSEEQAGVQGDSFVVLPPGRPELLWFDQQGRLAQVARWSRRRVPSSEVYPTYIDSSLAGYRRGTDREDEAFYTELYKQDLPIPEYAPLYTTLKVDDERRVWLERFRLPGDTGPRRWDVIAPTGEWLGTVAVPPRFTLFRAGRDYVLGRTLDSLGVERVQRHRVRPVR
jgi:hypothetical protein